LIRKFDGLSELRLRNCVLSAGLPSNPFEFLVDSREIISGAREF